MKKIYILVALFHIVFATVSQRVSTQEYIKQYKDLAVAEMYRAKIPASITLAQGLLESDAGNSSLTKESNNHFGIKCKKNWEGKKVYHDDDTLQECFRAYETADKSYKDHSDFLISQPRYAFLFSLEPNDYKGWAYGLKKAGYATNPSYPEMLIAYIEKNELHHFDSETPGEQKQLEIKQDFARDARKEININETPGVIAKTGDTWQLIAIENDMRVWQIFRYNDLEDDAVCKVGDTVYLKPKRNKAEQDTYIVPKGGENLYAISQRFAIKLHKLRDRNLMEPNEEALPGETIYLNNTRDNKPKVYIKTASPKTIDTTTEVIPENKPAEKPKPPTKVILPTPVVIVAPSEIKDSVKLPAPPARNADPVLVEEKKNEVDNKPPSDSNHYRIQKGDNLYRISKKFNLTVAELKQLNAMVQDTISVGTELLVRQMKAAAKPKNMPPTTTAAQKTHLVKGKETIYSICKLYDVTEEALKRENPLIGEAGLKVGQELIIPSPTKNKEEKRTTINTHIVNKGDTLTKISKKYHISKQELIKLNKLKGEQINIGQELKLK
jgi:LysM repeat protein